MARSMSSSLSGYRPTSTTKKTALRNSAAANLRFDKHKGRLRQRSPQGKYVVVHSELTTTKKTMRRPKDKLIAGIDPFLATNLARQFGMEGKKLLWIVCACRESR